MGLDLPDGWFPDYIGTGAFHDSANLQSVLLPDALAGIYTNAFNGPKNNRFLLYFDSFTPLQLLGYTKEKPFRFGDDESKIEIMVPFGYEKEYIAAWMYPMAGYADLDEMAADVRSELEQNGKTPGDVEVYEEVGKRLLTVENRLRQMMDLDPITDVTELEGDLPGLLAEAKEKAAQEKEQNGEEKPQQNQSQENKVDTSVEDPSNADGSNTGSSNAGDSSADPADPDSSHADASDANSSSQGQDSAGENSGASNTEQNTEEKDISVENNTVEENDISTESAADEIAVFSMESIQESHGWQKIGFGAARIAAESPVEGKSTDEEEVLRW